MAAAAAAPAFVPTASAPAPVVKSKPVLLPAANAAVAGTGEVVRVSPIDGVMPRYPSTTMWLYRNTTGKADFMPTALLRASLQHVLSQYPILCGTLRDRADGNFEVVLSNSGCGWIEATVSAPFPDASAFGAEEVPLPPGRDLLPMEVIRPDVPTCVQVTRYACGTVVLSVSVWHSMLDGHAHFHFANHWAALTRALVAADGHVAAAVRATEKLYPAPLHDRWGLMGPATKPSDLTYHYDHSEYVVKEPPKPDPKPEPAPAPKAADGDGKGKDKPAPAAAPAFVMPKCTTKLFHFSDAELNAMKAAAQKNLPAGEFVSTNDALCAHIWRCITRARTADLTDAAAAETNSQFGMACNGRARLQPPLPDHYCGNVNYFIAARRTVAELRAADADGGTDAGAKGLAATALQLRHRVERMTNDRMRAANVWLAEQPDLKLVSASFQSFFTFDAAFTQWAKMPMYDADFGAGKPAYVGLPNVDLDGLSLLYAVPPAYAGGGQAVHLGLTQANMQRLLADPEWRRFRPKHVVPTAAITFVPPAKVLAFADIERAGAAATPAAAIVPAAADAKQPAAAPAAAAEAAAGAGAKQKASPAAAAAAAAEETDSARGWRTALYIASAAAFVAGAVLAYNFFASDAPARAPKSAPK